MASINQWVSVLRASAAQGDATVHLASQNLDPEIEVTATVQIPAKSSTINIAKSISNAINNRLVEVDLNYKGTPSFEETNPPDFRLRSRQTGHLIDIWSQAEFEIKSVIAPPGSYVHFGSTPVYATFDDVPKYSAAVGATTLGGCSTDQQLLGALLAGSGDILSAADGFFVVAAQYLHEESRNFFMGWNFDHYPIVAVDEPTFRGDNGNYYGFSGGYQVNNTDGTVKMLMQSSPIMNRVSRVKYDLKHSYVAGLAHVHEMLKMESIRFAAISMWPAHISKVKRGSGAIEMVDTKQVREDFRSKLARLIG